MLKFYKKIYIYKNKFLEIEVYFNDDLTKIKKTNLKLNEVIFKKGKKNE